MKIPVLGTRPADLPLAARISRIIETPSVTPFPICAGTCDLIRPGKSRRTGL